MFEKNTLKELTEVQLIFNFWDFKPDCPREPVAYLRKSGLTTKKEEGRPEEKALRKSLQEEMFKEPFLL
jgi:hypothetical protein